KMQTADHSVPIGVRLLKLQLSTIEASIPPEAIQPFWTDGYRKSWGVKLHSTTSLEEIFQMLTLLEAAIKRDHLSSEFETTSELLNLNTQDNPSQNHVGLSGSAAVLPWVPDTTAAIALRMLDLDSAVSYMQNQKMERNGGDFMKPPSRFVAVKNAQELDPLETTGLDLFDGRWATGSGRRGRGRGSRGGSRGGRGRSRGGRVPRGISISSRIGFKDENEASRKNTRRGRTRGRGRGRGRRTVRSRQPSEGKGRSIPKENLLGSFSMLSNAKAATVEESPRSSGADEWGLENRRPYIDGDENSSGSQLDQSEDNEENGQPMDEEYDEQVPDYSRGYSGGSRPHGMIDDDVSEEEDEDVEGDDDGEEDDADRAVDDVDAEMDEDDDIGDDGEDGGDGGDGVEANADEDEGGSSYSSEYSD
ncbi:Os01g0672300, partial [Oryza sativa Japonica Group]